MDYQVLVVSQVSLDFLEEEVFPEILDLWHTPDCLETLDYLVQMDHLVWSEKKELPEIRDIQEM